MGAIQRKSLDQPDEMRTFPKGIAQLARAGSLTIGRGVLDPGWRWSTHLKPLTGSDSCQIHHLEVLISGRFRIEMDDGETAEFGPGDVFDVPPGHDAWVVGDDPVVLLDVFGNIGQVALPSDSERAVLTIVMSDIVESTAMVRSLGDAAWKQRLAEHDRMVRAQLDRFRGREVKTTGDGFQATFPSAVGALRCAAAMRDATRALGLPIRVGVHTGEIDVLATEIGGIAVHATARVMALGGAHEVMVSSMTRGLAEGSGLHFEERGRQRVKGLDEPIEVFLLAG